METDEQTSSLEPAASPDTCDTGGIWKSCQRQFLWATVYRALIMDHWIIGSLILSVFVHACIVHSPRRLTPCVSVQTHFEMNQAVPRVAGSELVAS
jgi:hypothetical protein